MKTVPIKLPLIEDVRNFVNVISKYEIDMDLVSGRYTIDAKSLMGIFSLDLLNPINFIVHTDDEKKLAQILEDVKKYTVQ